MLPFIGETDNSNNFLGYLFGARTYSEQENFIPSSLKRIYFTGDSIPAYSFKNSKEIEWISLGDNLSKIGQHAFENCTSLNRIDLPAILDKIEGGAFLNCSQLTKITFADGSKLNRIEEHAFENCSSLTDVVFPDGLEQICDSAFQNCTALSNVSFARNGKLIRIGTDAFNTCSSLTRLNFPVNLEIIEKSSFQNCAGLTSIDSVENAKLKTVEASAFEGCLSLYDVKLPESLTSIGKNAFRNCATLNKIEIPRNVKQLPENLFYGCGNLTTVTFAERATGDENDFTAVGKGSFRNCVKLTNVTLPDTTTQIGTEAFYGCSYLKSFRFPAGLKEIGDSAFADCEILTGIDIPGGLESLGSSAFMNCKGLTSISIPYAISIVSPNAFYGCVGLKNVTFSQSLIPSGTTSFVYGSMVRTIGGGAFAGCSGLETVSLSDGISAINGSAFAGCEKLNNLTLPADLKRIGSDAFENCASITYLLIPYGVTTIGDRAFRNCTKLEMPSLPASVVAVGEYAFQNCVSIREFHCTGSSLSFGTRAFDGCASLESILLSDGVVGMGSRVFANCDHLTVYTSYESAPAQWASDWNPDRPVFWKCTVSSVSLANLEFSYVISFPVYSGMLVTDPETITNSTAVNGISAPFRSGYMFAGWYTNADCTGQAYTARGIAGAPAGTYYAKWKKPTASFDLNGGTGQFDSYDFDAGDRLYIPTDVPQKTGYRFKYWALESDLTEAFDLNTRVYTDIRLVAVWETWLRFSLINGETEYEVMCGDVDLSGEVEIPSSYKGMPVTSIAREGFKDCRELTGIIIPESITEICASAFEGCDCLGKAVISGSSLKEIGDHAFFCTSLTSIRIPESVQWIGENVFCGCNMLREVLFDESPYLNTINIGSYAFADCYSLESIMIPSGVEHMGDYVFSGWTKEQVIYILADIERIESWEACWAEGCEARIIWGGYGSYYTEGLEFRDNGSGYDVAVGTSLDHGEEVIVIPATYEGKPVTGVADHGFYGCENLRKVIFTTSWYLTEIADYAFAGCTALENVNIPKSVVYIGSSAFENCTSLKSLTIPEFLTYISGSAMDGAREYTVYAETQVLHEEWVFAATQTSYNIIFGCELSEDKTYVVSVTINEDNIFNTTIAPPYREGYEFIGWSGDPNRDEAEYSIDDLSNDNLPFGMVLYAVWTKIEE